MPKSKDLKSILIIGSGPIVIGQACEFDYSGTQALRSLREDGIETILINSNPATIMTDPGVADKTYIEPITLEILEKIIKKEKPSAILPINQAKPAAATPPASHENKIGSPSPPRKPVLAGSTASIP